VIAFVDGVLVKSGPEATVAVAGGGVGLDILLSSRGAAHLPAPGERVRLWTHLVVREDGWTLYGFPQENERAMFRLLISVTGVGPKLALSMLSGASPEAIAGFLRLGDEKSLATLPGIGKKSAARLVVELGQRIPAQLTIGDETTSPAGGPLATGLAEAIAVLASLGLAPVQAEALLREARERDPAAAEGVETWVRGALALLPAARGRKG
jgi:Holliday junction DNA helicase RuvA